MEPCTGETAEFAKEDNKSSPISVMISDPRVFDCCICFQPLSTPVFLCGNGHIVCSTCCDKLGKVCDKCSNRIGLKSFRAFDNLLQSIKMSCSNEKHGCKKTISFSDKRKHEDECIYEPCYCPFSGCEFVASSESLSNHFSHKHGDSLIKFSYGHSFIVSLKSNDEVTVLQEKTNGKLFILNNSTTVMGNAIDICFIGPKFSMAKYGYTISARFEKCNLKFTSSSKNVQRVDLTTLSPPFLLIPFGYFGSSKLLNLKVFVIPEVFLSPPFHYFGCIFPIEVLLCFNFLV
ncbi:hypothetical protein RYX36_006417 [Vicia faba]